MLALVAEGIGAGNRPPAGGDLGDDVEAVSDEASPGTRSEAGSSSIDEDPAPRHGRSVSPASGAVVADASIPVSRGRTASPSPRPRKVPTNRIDDLAVWAGSGVDELARLLPALGWVA